MTQHNDQIPEQQPHSYERPALRLKRSAPAKRDGVTNHTFTFGGMTLLVQTRGGAGPKKMCSPGLIFVGDVAIGKSHDGRINTTPELEQKILDAALPLFDEEEQASIMEKGWEGLRLARTMNTLTSMAIDLLREGDRADALPRILRSLTGQLKWGDSWPSGTYAVRYIKASFGIDYGLSLTWEEALRMAQEWAQQLAPTDRDLLDKATGGEGINMPPEELRTASSLRRDFNSAGVMGACV